MAVAKFLADKSALARGHLDEIATVIERLLKAGLLATCGIAQLELLYSARSAADFAQLAAELNSAYEWLHTDDEDYRRATEVYAELVDAGQHRSVAMPDLLIAAVAERHRVTVLHYDSDFDRIAGVTGQPTEWIAPRGSLN